MNYEIVLMSHNLNLTKPVKQFVKDLSGRYAKFVSDEFLTELLVCRIAKELNNKREINNVAYNVGCEIFEDILEGHLRSGGNGHYVAQALASIFPS